MLLALLVFGHEVLAGVPSRRPSDLVRGEELYVRHCVACHGPKAAGDGPAASALVHPVPDLRNRVHPSPEAILLLMAGKGAMPSFEASFDRDDARRVLLYMEKLPEGVKKEDNKPKPRRVERQPK